MAQKALASGAIVLPGVPRCYALRVAPQTECKVEYRLAEFDVPAFHPVRTHYETRRGERVELRERLAPGFVFATFPGPVIWHRLRERIPAVHGVVTFRLSCEPACIHPDDVDRLLRMAYVDVKVPIGTGDMVKLMEGPMAGAVVEVVTIKSGRASFRIRMFGAEGLPASAPLSAMVKAAE